MYILLVEPDYHRIKLTDSKNKQKERSNNKNDELLWYPPIGLMKLARFHKDRGDIVKFVYGQNNDILNTLWDRVYITTLFTYNWEQTIKTINFYKNATGGIYGNIFIGGIMASVISQDIYEATGIFPITGIIDSAHKIGFDENINIDLLPPDYDILDPNIYAVNDTYYSYTTRGCVNKCAWCAVPKIEPDYLNYIDIKPIIIELRNKYGDKSKLKLMDNNILASNKLPSIVNDLCEIGYSKGSYTNNGVKKQRVIDFNQGIDASFINEDTMSQLSKLNIKPIRIAFDRLKEKESYIKAINIAKKYGFKDFSNYMLFNWKDRPKDLYDRLIINIDLNDKWRNMNGSKPEASVYSYPMRYAPIDNDKLKLHSNRKRDMISNNNIVNNIDFINNPNWTNRFIRNVEIMKGAAHGAISTTPSLALRTIGESFEDFIFNLYMPEILLRNRNKYEKRVYKHEPERLPGNGMVEQFKSFLLKLIKTSKDEFIRFHNAVSNNTVSSIRDYIKECKKKEILKWLNLYLQR